MGVRHRGLADIAHGGAGRHFAAGAGIDLGSARTRATGGVAQPGAQNPHATTGTTPNETFVGRAGADETLDPGRTGAEARGDAAEGRGEGAARDA